MSAETLFFITGSAFFLLSALILVVVVVYAIKIFSSIVAIQSEFKGALQDVRSKVTSFTFGFAALMALLEKALDLKRDAKPGKKSRESEEPVDDDRDNKDKKVKKIKVIEVQE